MLLILRILVNPLASWFVGLEQVNSTALWVLTGWGDCDRWTAFGRSRHGGRPRQGSISRSQTPTHHWHPRPDIQQKEVRPSNSTLSSLTQDNLRYLHHINLPDFKMHTKMVELLLLIGRAVGVCSIHCSCVLFSIFQKLCFSGIWRERECVRERR